MSSALAEQLRNLFTSGRHGGCYFFDDFFFVFFFVFFLESESESPDEDDEDEEEEEEEEDEDNERGREGGGEDILTTKGAGDVVESG